LVMDAMVDVFTHGVFVDDQILTVFRQSTGLSDAVMGGPTTATMTATPTVPLEKEKDV